MLIIEGPDGSGKSTLIRQMRENYLIEVAPRVVTTEAQPLESLAAWVDMENAKGFQHRVYDRHRLISNSIYAPVLKAAREPIFKNLDWVSDATETFYENQPWIVFCLPPLEVVRENCLNDATNRWLKPYIDALYEAYVARAGVELALRPNHTTIYDYTRQGDKYPLAPLTPWLDTLFERRDYAE